MEKTWEELPRKFTPALKKRITNDWHQFFPESGIRRPLAFKKRMGCLLFSFSLGASRDGEDYKPVYSVHNLSRELSFISAILSHQLQTLRNTPDFFRVRWHDKNYKEAGPRMRSQAYLPLEGPVSLRQVIDAYKDHLEKNPHDIFIDCVEDPAMICAWAGRDDLAKECLEWGYETFKTWSEGIQQQKGGLDVWYDRMQKIIADPESLRRITREQVALKKLEKIPYQDFCDATYKEAE